MEEWDWDSSFLPFTSPTLVLCAFKKMVQNKYTIGWEHKLYEIPRESFHK